MTQIDLVCRKCGRRFQISTHFALSEKRKRCPGCGSDSVRQTLSSYLLNGPLSDPDCGAPGTYRRYG